jgi:hypothetical protein
MALRLVPVVLLGGLLFSVRGPALAPMGALAEAGAPAPVGMPAEAGAVAAGTGTCTFSPRFQALRDRLPDLVGGCLEDEQPNPANGNLEQRTAGGLLAWSKADDTVAFTDGANTWYACPDTVEQRASTETFGCGSAAASAAEPAPAMCPDALHWSEAGAHVGTPSTVYGSGIGTSRARGTTGQSTVLALGSAAASRDHLRINIPDGVRASFLLPPEQLYDGKRLCVTGIIRRFEDTLGIEVTSSTSILAAS